MRFSQVGEKICQNSMDMLMIDKMRSDYGNVTAIAGPVRRRAVFFSSIMMLLRA